MRKLLTFLIATAVAAVMAGGALGQVGGLGFPGPLGVSERLLGCFAVGHTSRQIGH